MLENDRLIRSLLREPVDRRPVWVMRQAGRYLPEYRKVREKAGDFLKLCKTPELACEVTLQPIQRFPLDAAIIFSDILTIPDAYGLGLYFTEGEGPGLKNPIRTLRDIASLRKIHPEEELNYVLEAIRLTKRALGNKLPLIGFAGSPWTLACYMVEGKASKQFTEIKRFLYQEPQAVHQLLKHLSDSVYDYLNAQIEAGVEVVMIFDSWASLLTPKDYLSFSLKYMQEIVQRLKVDTKTYKIPVILFSKNSGIHLEEMANTGCEAIGLDWTTDLKQAKTRIGDKVALQGNLDPSALYAEPADIRAAVKDLLQSFGPGPGHIVNLGHGIAPDVKPDHLACMVEAVHELSSEMLYS